MEENSETVLCAVKGVKQSQSLFNHIRKGDEIRELRKEQPEEVAKGGF